MAEFANVRTPAITVPSAFELQSYQYMLNLYGGNTTENTYYDLPESPKTYPNRWVPKPNTTRDASGHTTYLGWHAAMLDAMSVAYSCAESVLSQAEDNSEDFHFAGYDDYDPVYPCGGDMLNHSSPELSFDPSHRSFPPHSDSPLPIHAPRPRHHPQTPLFILQSALDHRSSRHPKRLRDRITPPPPIDTLRCSKDTEFEISAAVLQVGSEVADVEVPWRSQTMWNSAPSTAPSSVDVDSDSFEITSDDLEFAYDESDDDEDLMDLSNDGDYEMNLDPDSKILSSTFVYGETGSKRKGLDGTDQREASWYPCQTSLDRHLYLA
ncbi:hypothetical protein EIP91_002721 [Steccherinum ochraceum]|uniref:Uncharacterized protein n=1 Tax=Steccherinum ochraceum TaxID=92696 RepID=A0A4R0RNF1_9APHY|nr:hypothetical protein EIP91_002721 [Steccherinum ochraceum]